MARELVPIGAVAWALIASPGCETSDPLGRQAVAGVVTLDGRPLERGLLLLEPISPEAGTAVGAKIRDGRFAIDRREGPVPGSYRVRIYASSGRLAPEPGASDRKPRPMIDRIPARYNAESTLRAVVPRGGDDRLRFELASDRPPPSAP